MHECNIRHLTIMEDAFSLNASSFFSYSVRSSHSVPRHCIEHACLLHPFIVGAIF